MVDDLGVCPAATEERLDGVHDGTNAGRTCWVVAGTFCDGEAACIFVKEVKDCTHCEVHKKVSNEEFPYLLPTPELLRRLK